jgi:hypothetical protein
MKLSSVQCVHSCSPSHNGKNSHTATRPSDIEDQVMIEDAGRAVRALFCVRTFVEDSPTTKQAVYDKFRLDAGASAVSCMAQVESLMQFSKSKNCQLLFEKSEYLHVAREFLVSTLHLCSEVLTGLLHLVRNPPHQEAGTVGVPSAMFSSICLFLREVDMRPIQKSGTSACTQGDSPLAAVDTAIQNHMMTIVYTLIHAIEPPNAINPHKMSLLTFEHVCLALILQLMHLCAPASHAEYCYSVSEAADSRMNPYQNVRLEHEWPACGYDLEHPFDSKSCMAMDIARVACRTVDPSQGPLFTRHAAVCNRILCQLLQKGGVSCDDDILLSIVRCALKHKWVSMLLTNANSVCLQTCSEALDALCGVVRTIHHHMANVVSPDKHDTALRLNNMLFDSLRCDNGICMLLSALTRSCTLVGEDASAAVHVSVTSQQVLHTIICIHTTSMSIGDAGRDRICRLQQSEMVLIGVALMRRMSSPLSALSTMQRSDLLWILLSVFESGCVQLVIEEASYTLTRICASNLLVCIPPFTRSRSGGGQDTAATVVHCISSSSLSSKTVQSQRTPRSQRRTQTHTHDQIAALAGAVGVHLLCNPYTCPNVAEDIRKRLSPLADTLSAIANDMPAHSSDALSTEVRESIVHTNCSRGAVTNHQRMPPLATIKTFVDTFKCTQRSPTTP